MKKLMKTLLAVIMIACFAVMSTACISGKPEKVKAKLEKADYMVMQTTNETEIAAALASMLGSDADAENVECFMMASKGEDGIFIVFCKDSKTAREIKKDAKEYLKEMKEAAEKIGGEAEEELKDVKVGKNGKVVYFGNKAAIKAAR